MSTPKEEEKIMNQGGLSFGDGFKFGCGFYVAAIVAGTIFMIIGAILMLVVTVLGIGSIGALGTLMQGM